MFEFENFSHGTKALMDAVVHATSRGTTSIIGKSRVVGCNSHILGDVDLGHIL